MPESLIAPELPGGFRDYLPREQSLRTSILRTIEEVYQSFGFLPLDTPEVERWSVLTGNQNPGMRIYKIYLDNQKTEEPLALRFDLTVPLARVVAAYGKDLPKPFKRYQLGRVFRGETSQKGRYNGFYQFDIDTVYSSSMVSDAETVGVIWHTFQALQIPKVNIKINNRKILNGLAELVGVQTKATVLFQTLDRIDKIGLADVLKFLQREPENEWDDTALALSLGQIKIIEDFLEISAKSSDPLTDIGRFFDNRTLTGIQGIAELRDVMSYAHDLGVPETRVNVDLAVARGLGYYTGPVFETSLEDLPEIGSVFSGGRFDGLVGRFANTSVPATGASIGVDRLFTAMEELQLLGRFQSVATQVFILVFNKEYLSNYLQLATRIRNAGLAVEVYSGDEMSFKFQMAYAVKQEIPLLIIGGPEEFAQDTWQIKDLRTHRQTQIGDDALVVYLQGLLK